MILQFNLCKPDLQNLQWIQKDLLGMVGTVAPLIIKIIAKVTPSKGCGFGLKTQQSSRKRVINAFKSVQTNIFGAGVS